MSKRPSLEALAAEATFSRRNVETSKRHNVETSHLPAIAPPQRQSAPHMSLYIGKKVQRVLKEIALEYDRKPHDLLLEAVDMMLRRYGRPSIGELSETS